MKKPTIGFIGQGWIGKNYANDFEARGYDVVRYALEEPYAQNKEAITTCDIVFVAVPTPTNVNGFDASIVRAVMPLIGKGKIAVVKSTLLPGTTESLQKEFPDRIVLCSPEFLREKHAAHDASHPERNLIGIPEDTTSHTKAAELVLSVSAKADFSKVMPSRAAELTKYAGNVFLANKVVLANIFYDLSQTLGVEYETLREALAADPRIGASHLFPVDASGHTDKKGRGAGGDCFIKDLEAFRQLYKKANDVEGDALLSAVVRKNNALLTQSDKDIELLRGVYGKDYDVLP
jgi:nucleotide sugar dehydrogenase